MWRKPSTTPRRGGRNKFSLFRFFCAQTSRLRCLSNATGKEAEAMFEDSLVESSGRLAARHPWATVASFAAQCIALAFLLLLSLIYTESLPSQRWTYILEAPPPPPAASVPSAQVVMTSASHARAIRNVLVVPREMAKTVSAVDEQKPGADKPFGIAGDIPGGVPDGIPYGVGHGLRSIAPMI